VAAVDAAGTTYMVTVTGMTGAGTITASIPANQAIGTSAPNAVSTSTDNQVTYIVPVTSAAVAASSSSSSKCGSGLHAALVPLLLLGLWRRRRS
jgi:hypothetical protein